MTPLAQRIAFRITELAYDSSHDRETFSEMVKDIVEDEMVLETKDAA